MAIAAVGEAETRLCGNCKKDISVANFITHETHCSRNIEVCRYCSELIPKSEMKNHIESEHVQVTCKCRMKIEKCLLKDHEVSACPLRPALCQYCDIQLPFSKLQDHEMFCGARTEPCPGCSLNIMVKDLKEHPRVCGQEVKHVRGSRAVPRAEDADLHALRDVGNHLRSEDDLEQLERNENTYSSLYEEWNADLDYVLALSLQNENNSHNNAAAEISSDFWENYYAKEAVPSACLNEADRPNIFSCDSSVPFGTSNRIKNDDITMLPCEFCEELYPAEDLILHQTGCNPASAFASFSKRSSSPNPREYDGLRALGSKGCRSLSSPQAKAVQAGGDIVIPCEFCGVQLEEETVFLHQHHCDLRPGSPAAGLPAQRLLPPADKERREAPEPARRRIRHQGDVSPQCLEGFGQQRLGHSVRGTKSQSNTANAKNAPASSSARAADAPDAPDARGQPGKAAAGGGRPKNRAAGDSAGGTTPRARPAQSFCSESFTSSFSRPSPTRLSPSTRGGRSLEVSGIPLGSRRGSTKAKAQSPASDYPEEK
ncbi:TRAF-type zinc finger domain-containing protein 1 isoform X1 [Caloenas nicobarica]|uniref:TRAF-type zinc finger domain-containing protein 1 isoform X1 n=2 Tax=Caloenas nicobarica TaxID=187106 RepID=UPI0032B8177F